MSHLSLPGQKNQIPVITTPGRQGRSPLRRWGMVGHREQPTRDARAQYARAKAVRPRGAKLLSVNTTLKVTEQLSCPEACSLLSHIPESCHPASKSREAPVAQAGFLVASAVTAFTAVQPQDTEAQLRRKESGKGEHSFRVFCWVCTSWRS